jgi:hypothetical protein
MVVGDQALGGGVALVQPTPNLARLLRKLMRYTRSQATGKAGVIFVDGVVNAHGSVFRPVHQEDDFGIDGFIELVASEEASGRLVAVQIKSGDSYLTSGGQEFSISVDDRHLRYWQDFMVPVILVCYSPTKQVGAWTSVRNYIEREEYFERAPISNVRVPLYRAFNIEALSKGIAGLAHVRADERKLIDCADRCLDPDLLVRRSGFQVLSQHPDSRGRKTTCLIARRLLLDVDPEIAKDALFTLGYGVGRRRWTWNPNNQGEGSIVAFASNLCSDLSDTEIRRIIELVDDEDFHGPRALGERCFDVLCCSDRAQRILSEVASDKDQPIVRRANCLYMELQCDDDELEESAANFRKDPNIADVIDWMLGPSSEQFNDAAGA